MKKLLFVVITFLCALPCQSNGVILPLARTITRLGGSAILFTNYWVMNELIKRGHIIDQEQKTHVNPAIYTVYNIYKNASLVCAIGLLLPKNVPPALVQVVKKHW